MLCCLATIIDITYTYVHPYIGYYILEIRCTYIYIYMKRAEREVGESFLSGDSTVAGYMFFCSFLASTNMLKKDILLTLPVFLPTPLSHPQTP